MHQLPPAFFQSEDHGDAQSHFTSRQLGLESLYFEDIGQIGSLYSGDLLEDTITALDHTGGAIRFFFNALPTMPEPPNGFASVTSSLLDDNLLFGSGSPTTKASTRPTRSLDHVVKVGVLGFCHDARLISTRDRGNRNAVPWHQAVAPSEVRLPGVDDLVEADERHRLFATQPAATGARCVCW
jgi:hypothetical protein